MSYVIFFVGTLILAISFPHWEPTGRIASCVGHNRLLGFVGVVGHIGGTAAIAWVSGFGPGLLAFIAIPAAASVVYSLIVIPLMRSKRRKRQSPARPIGTRPAIREL